MPASFAHQCFGDDLYEKQDEKTRKLIDRYRNLYNIGLQGPDLLFYYHPLSRNAIKEKGIRMHHQEAWPFFTANRDDENGALVYILGFLCHFILDSVCHPYINHVTDSDFTHYALEREFDMHLIKIKDASIYSVAKRYRDEKNDMHIIAGVLGLSDDEALKAVKSFRFYNHFVYIKNTFTRDFWRKVTALAHVSFSSMFIYQEENEGYHTDVSHLVSLYEKALDIGKELMPLYLDQRVTLPDYFHKDYE